MLNSPPNSDPFLNRTAIRDLDSFFGRTPTLRRFYAAIANRQSVSIVGQRHIGKTSFLLCASQPNMRERTDFDLSHHIFVYLDLRTFLHKTCDDFFEMVSNKLIARCADSIDFSLASEGTSEDKFSLLLEQIVDKQFFPVLLLDAFENITLNKHFNPEFFAFLRAQATIGNISYVTVTVSPLAEVCHRGIADSPFFNIFYNLPLGLLDLQEAQDLITVPAERTGLAFTAAERDFILYLAGRHPFFIQCVCHHVFEEKVLHNDVDRERIRKQAYEDLLPHFNHTWEDLSKDDQFLLEKEARKLESSERKLPELSESYLFRQFVRRICDVKMFELALQDVEDALEKLDDARALGETNLRFLNIVVSRQTNPSTSTVERGLIIRAVLNDAFERLLGPIKRTDTDPALQSYNILYYRYFKHHFKNDQVAARIGFSPRQYFRYRTKAIDALRNMLFEMENASILHE